MNPILVVLFFIIICVFSAESTYSNYKNQNLRKAVMYAFILGFQICMALVGLLELITFE